MNGGIIARASAATLVTGGILLLFAADSLLPALVPSFPASAAWLGQLIGAGWLAMAVLNWTTRDLLIGGVYGRPVVMANSALYFISATVIGKAITRTHPTLMHAVTFAICALFAIAYGWLLYRGPFEKEFAARRAQVGADGSVR
jgi:hypothetical protein